MIKMNQNETFKKAMKKEYDDNKELHTYSIDYLMQNEAYALRLQLDNLVLTYGLKAVQTILKKTSLDVVAGSKQTRKAS